MFCSHCGIKIEGNTLYCPHCGERIPSPEVPNSFPRWLRWLIGIALVGLLFSLYFFITNPEPQTAITDQLNALKKGQYTEAYYDSTSRDFQEATSLEKFKDVIHAFPYLTQVKELKILQEEVQNVVATLKVALTTEDNFQFVMEYQLVKDDGKWKILYFKLLKEQTAAPESHPEAALHEELKLEESEKLVQNFLNDIAHHNLQNAWQEYTTEAFKQAAPFEAFKQVIASYDILKNFKSIEGAYLQMASLQAELQSTKGKTGKVQFDLLREKGQLKIQQIRIFN